MALSHECDSDYAMKWPFSIKNVFEKSHERIFRCILITQLIASFPIMTCYNRILSNVNVFITYEDVLDRAINLNKTCTWITRYVPIRKP